MRRKFGESSIWRKKVWQINRSANRLSIVSTKLDGFSLANHRRFTKFAKLSPHQTFLLYGMPLLPECLNCDQIQEKPTSIYKQKCLEILIQLLEVLYLRKENGCLHAICHNSIAIYSQFMEQLLNG